MHLLYMKVILNQRILIPDSKKWNHLCSHIDPGYSLDYTGCEKVEEDAAYLLLAVKEAARVMLGSLLVKLVGESMLPVL